MFSVVSAFNLKIALGPLGGSISATEWPPFWNQKSTKFFQRAAKKDLGAFQDEPEGEKKSSNSPVGIDSSSK